jgi:ABC-type Mn2+/Zn2+ transport system permease subunit
MTLVTGIVIGFLCGYRVKPQSRAFLLTLGAIVIVLIPQTILLWNADRASIDAFYPLVQVVIVGIGYLTTWLGGWLRNRRTQARLIGPGHTRR